MLTKFKCFWDNVLGIWDLIKHLLYGFKYAFRQFRFYFNRSSTAQKIKFPADFVTFTEEILNGKLHFLCSPAFQMFFGCKTLFKSHSGIGVLLYICGIFSEQNDSLFCITTFFIIFGVRIFYCSWKLLIIRDTFWKYFFIFFRETVFWIRPTNICYFAANPVIIYFQESAF